MYGIGQKLSGPVAGRTACPVCAQPCELLPHACRPASGRAGLSRGGSSGAVRRCGGLPLSQARRALVPRPRGLLPLTLAARCRRPEHPSASHRHGWSSRPATGKGLRGAIPAPGSSAGSRRTRRLLLVSAVGRGRGSGVHRSALHRSDPSGRHRPVPSDRYRCAPSGQGPCDPARRVWTPRLHLRDPRNRCGCHDRCRRGRILPRPGAGAYAGPWRHHCHRGCLRHSPGSLRGPCSGGCRPKVRHHGALRCAVAVWCGCRCRAPCRPCCPRSQRPGLPVVRRARGLRGRRAAVPQTVGHLPGPAGCGHHPGAACVLRDAPVCCPFRVCLLLERRRAHRCRPCVRRRDAVPGSARRNARSAWRPRVRRVRVPEPVFLRQRHRAQDAVQALPWRDPGRAGAPVGSGDRSPCRGGQCVHPCGLLSVPRGLRRPSSPI